jgi:hypothetical protein
MVALLVTAATTVEGCSRGPFDFTNKAPHLFDHLVGRHIRRATNRGLWPRRSVFGYALTLGRAETAACQRRR